MSTNDFVIASPNPVPSVVVFFSISNLSNFVNNLLIFSAFIPRPVSLQLIIKFVLFFSKAEIMLPTPP